MLTGIINVYYLVIDFPGASWRTLKNFFGDSLGKWWYSHY